MAAAAQRADDSAGAGTDSASGSLGAEEAGLCPTGNGGYPAGTEARAGLCQLVQGWAYPALRKSWYREDNLPAKCGYGLGSQVQSQGCHALPDGLRDQWSGTTWPVTAGSRYHAFGSDGENCQVCTHHGAGAQPA